MQIEDQSVKDQLYYDSGFRETWVYGRRHTFSVCVNQIIDEDNFLSLQFKVAQNVAKFCILAKERGYSDIDIFDSNVIDIIGSMK